MIEGVRIADGVICDGFLWFSNNISNGLFRMDIVSKITEFVGYFPDEEPGTYFMHKRCFSYGKRLVFVPALCRSISVYDTDDKSFRSIKLKNDIEGEAILDAVMIKNNVYIFPRNQFCIPVKLDVENLELDEIVGFDKEIDRYIKHDDPEKFYRTCVFGDDIYFPIKGTEIIARWNVSTLDFQVFNTGDKGIINILVKDNKCFYTIRERYGLRSLDLNTLKITDICCERLNDRGENMYGCLFDFKGMIVAAPSFGEYIHIYDDKKMICEYIFDDDVKDQYKFFKYACVGEEAWLLPLGIDEIFVIKKDGSVRRTSMTFSHETEEFFIDRSLEEDHLIVENETIGLKEFCSYITKQGSSI